jgi:hypothetical protein
MRCNDLQEQIDAFAAGDLAPFPAWRLRRHLAHCSVCAARLYRAKTLNLNLADMSVAAPSDLLRQRVFGDLEYLASHGAEEESVWHGRERVRRRKRGYALAGALAAIAFTGTISVPLAQLFWTRSAVITLTDTTGRVWRISGPFTGIINLSDPQGRALVSSQFVGLGDEPGGKVKIDVQGEHFEMYGNGPHPLSDAQGNVFALLDLQSGSWPAWAPGGQAARPPMPNANKARILAHDPELWNAINRIRVHPDEVVGIYRPDDVAWRMQGTGVVKVLKPGSSKPLQQGQTAPPSHGQVIIPYFEWTINNRAGQANGYGAHPIRDRKGRVVLILKGEPSPR